MPPPPGTASASQLPPPGEGGSGASGGGAGPNAGSDGRPSSSSGSPLWKATVLVLKGALLWAPAALVWVSLVLDIDYRSDQDVQEDEHEVQRLERFFDVEGLPEGEYVEEWDAKEQALSKIVDKLLRSQRFMDSLRPGGLAGSGVQVGGEADNVEVSYILPPVPWHGGSIAAALQANPGPVPWSPRLVINHGEGSLALVSALFEHVARSKDREERWACTSLRSDLISSCDGEPTCESICDLRGPLPHGVRYMRF